MKHKHFQYQHVIVSLTVMFLSAGMAMITLQLPEKLMVYLEITGKEKLFTFRARTVADFIQILHLPGMNLPGQCMALITAIFWMATRTLAKKRPDIFKELFRADVGDPEMAEDEETAYEASNDNKGAASNDNNSVVSNSNKSVVSNKSAASNDKKGASKKFPKWNRK